MCINILFNIKTCVVGYSAMSNTFGVLKVGEIGSVTLSTHNGSVTVDLPSRVSVAEHKIDITLYQVVTFTSPYNSLLPPRYEERAVEEGGNLAQNTHAGFGQDLPCGDEEICVIYDTVSGDMFVRMLGETQKVR